VKGPGVEAENGQGALKGRIWVRGPGVLERVDEGTMVDG